MYYNKFKVVRIFSAMNPDMDYFILLDKETTSLTIAERIIKKAEQDWWDDKDGAGSSFVLPEYICCCLEENNFKVYLYIFRKRHIKNNRRTYRSLLYMV